MEERSRRIRAQAGSEQASNNKTAATCTRRQVAVARVSSVGASSGVGASLCWFGVWFAWTLLLVLFLSHAPRVSAWSTQYLYASGPLLVDDELAQSLGSDAWVRADVASNSDDDAQDLVDMQFAFPFMHDRRSLSISPNGVLLFDPNRIGCCAPVPDAVDVVVSGPPCIWVDEPCGCASLNSDYNYGDSVAPMLSDLDPTLSPGGLISYRSMPDRFDVRWQDLRLHGQETTPELDGQTFDFIASLHASGLVEFRYLRLIDMDLALATSDFPGYPVDGGGAMVPKGARCWNVGLRDAGWSALDAAREQRMAALEDRTPVDPHALTSSIYAAEIDTWGWPRPGFYPSRDLIRKNSTLSFCPISTSFCMHPTTLPTTGQQALQITAEQMQCAADGHAFFCRFSAPLSTATTADPASIDVAATFSAPSNSLTCMSPSLSTLRALNVSANAALSTFQLRLVDHTAANTQQVVGMDAPLLLSFIAGTIAPASPSAPGLCSSCSSLLPLYCVRDCTGIFLGNATLDTCGVCSGGSTGIKPNQDVGCSGRCFERVYVSDPKAVYTDFQGINHTLANDAADKECYCDRVYQMQYDDSTPTVSSSSGGSDGILAGASLAAPARPPAPSTSLMLRKLRGDIEAVSPASAAPAVPSSSPSPLLTSPRPPPLQRAFVSPDDSDSSSSSYPLTVFHDWSLPKVSWSSNYLQPSAISARAAAECADGFEIKLPLFYTIASETRYYRWVILSVLAIFVGIWVLLRQMDKNWREDGAGDFSQRGRQAREQRIAETRSRANSAAAAGLARPLRATRSTRTTRAPADSGSPPAASLARENGINEETEDHSTRRLRDFKQQSQQPPVRSGASKTVAASASAPSSSAASSSGGSLGSSAASSTIQLPAIAEAHPARLLASSPSGSSSSATLILPTAVAAASYHHSPSDSGLDSAAASASEVEAEVEGSRSGASSAVESAAEPSPLASPSASIVAATVAASTPFSPVPVVAAVSPRSHASQSARPLRSHIGERRLASSSDSEHAPTGSSAAASPSPSPHAPALNKQAKPKAKLKAKHMVASTATTETAGGAGSLHRDAKHKLKLKQSTGPQFSRSASPPLQLNSPLGASALPSSSQPLQQLQQQHAQQLYLQHLSYLAASANLATMDPVTAAAFTRAWNSGALALPASFAAGINMQMTGQMPAQMPVQTPAQMPLTMPLVMPLSPSSASPLPPSPFSPLHPLSPSAHPLAASSASVVSPTGGFAAGGFASSSRKSGAAVGGKKKRVAGAAGSSPSPPPLLPLSMQGMATPFVFASPSDASTSPVATPAAPAAASAASSAEPAFPTSEGHEPELRLHFKITPPDKAWSATSEAESAPTSASSSSSTPPSLQPRLPLSDEGQPHPHA